MNRVIFVASAVLALVVVSPHAEASVTSRAGFDSTMVGLLSTDSTAGIITATAAIRIPTAIVAEQQRRTGARRAVPRGSSARPAGREGRAGRSGDAGRSAAPPAARAPRAGRADGSVVRSQGRNAGRGTTVQRGPNRTAAGHRGRVAARTRGNSGNRGRTNIIVNNRYYRDHRVYRPYYGTSYRYGYPYYGTSYRPYGYYDPYYSGGYVAAEYQGYGWIRLKVKPRFADVFVDGYYVGVVDEYDGVFQRLQLTRGPHQVEIAAPGFAPVTFDVRIRPGRKIVYEQRLLPVP